MKGVCRHIRLHFCVLVAPQMNALWYLFFISSFYHECVSFLTVMCVTFLRGHARAYAFTGRIDLSYILLRQFYIDDGVSIDQWRGNIRFFDRITIVKSLKGCNEQDGLLIVQFLLKLLYLFHNLEVLYNLLLLFSYCTMTVTLFPIFLVMYHCFDHLLSADNSSNSLYHKILSHSLRTFLEMNLIPSRISRRMK